MNESKGKIVSATLRLLAFTADVAIIGFFCRLALVPLFLPPDWDLLSVFGILSSVWPAYLIGAVLLVFRDMRQGAGMGKRFLNMRVAMLDNNLSVPGPSVILKRGLFLLLLPAEAVIMVFDRHCRRLGDKFSGTVVIEAQIIQNFRFMTVRVIGMFSVIGGLWLAYILTSPLQIQKTAFYRAGSEYLTTVLKNEPDGGTVSGVSELNRDGENILLTLNVSGNKGETEREVTITLRRTENGYEALSHQDGKPEMPAAKFKTE